MTPRTRFLFLTAGLVSAGLLTAALNADAQQSPPAPPTAAAAPAPGAPQRPGGGQRSRFSPADRAAFFDARVAAIHAGLQLNADQEKLWPPVESAMRDVAKVRMSQREAMATEPRPSDPVQRLERMSDRTIARGQALKKLADAAGPLYGALSDDQKRRLPFLMHGMGGHRRMMHRRFAMMHEGRGGGETGWRHERGGQDGRMEGRMGGWRDRDRGMMGRGDRGFDAH